MPRSLLDLPDELLIEIINLSSQLRAPCESQQTDLFRVNRRLRRLSFDLLASKHVILNVRTFRTPEEMVDSRDQPMWFFFNESLIAHFKRVPSSWKSDLPHRIDIIRLDLWNRRLRSTAYGGIREYDFLCTAHGLTSLLCKYNHDLDGSAMVMCYTFPDNPGLRSQLFRQIFEMCETEVSHVGQNESKLDRVLVDTFPRDKSLLVSTPERVAGRDLCPSSHHSGNHNELKSRYAHRLLQVFEIVESCVQNSDIESASWILFHFGTFLVQRRSSGLGYLHLQEYIHLLRQPDWESNETISQWFKSTYLVAQLRMISILAWCSFMESDIASDRRWGRRHCRVIRSYGGKYKNFGLSSDDEGDLSFLECLYSCYQEACLHYVEYPGYKFDGEILQAVHQKMIRLRDAYSRSRRYPAFTKAYERISMLLTQAGAPLVPLLPEFHEKLSTDFIDADGILRSWSWPGDDRGEYNVLGHGANDRMVPYMFRAQRLAYEAKTFSDLKSVFLSHFERTLDSTARQRLLPA